MATTVQLGSMILMIEGRLSPSVVKALGQAAAEFDRTARHVSNEWGLTSKSMMRDSKMVDSELDKMVGYVKRVAEAWLVFEAARTIKGFIEDSVEAAKQAENFGAALKASLPAGETFASAMESIGVATKGLLPEYEQMRIATMLFASGLASTAEEAGQLAFSGTVLTTVFKAQSATWDKYIRLLQDGSDRLYDNFNLSKKTIDIYTEQAKATGNLTDKEAEMAAIKRILIEQGNRFSGSMGDLTTATMEAESAWANFTTMVGKDVAPAVEAASGTMTEFLTKVVDSRTEQEKVNAVLAETPGIYALIERSIMDKYDAMTAEERQLAAITGEMPEFNTEFLRMYDIYMKNAEAHLVWGGTYDTLAEKIKLASAWYATEITQTEKIIELTEKQTQSLETLTQAAYVSAQMRAEASKIWLDSQKLETSVYADANRAYSVGMSEWAEILTDDYQDALDDSQEAQKDWADEQQKKIDDLKEGYRDFVSDVSGFFNDLGDAQEDYADSVSDASYRYGEIEANAADERTDAETKLTEDLLKLEKERADKIQWVHDGDHARTAEKNAEDLKWWEDIYDAKEQQLRDNYDNRIKIIDEGAAKENAAVSAQQAEQKSEYQKYVQDMALLAALNVVEATGQMSNLTRDAADTAQEAFDGIESGAIDLATRPELRQAITNAYDTLTTAGTDFAAAAEFNKEWVIQSQQDLIKDGIKPTIDATDQVSVATTNMATIGGEAAVDLMNSFKPAAAAVVSVGKSAEYTGTDIATWMYYGADATEESTKQMGQSVTDFDEMALDPLGKTYLDLTKTVLPGYGAATKKANDTAADSFGDVKTEGTDPLKKSIDDLGKTDLTGAGVAATNFGQTVVNSMEDAQTVGVGPLGESVKNLADTTIADLQKATLGTTIDMIDFFGKVMSFLDSSVKKSLTDVTRGMGVVGLAAQNMWTIAEAPLSDLDSALGDIESALDDIKEAAEEAARAIAAVDVGGGGGGGGGSTWVENHGEGAMGAHGGIFEVPPGYPNDTYPVNVSSGEGLIVLPRDRMHAMQGFQGGTHPWVSGLESVVTGIGVTLPPDVDLSDEEQQAEDVAEAYRSLTSTIGGYYADMASSYQDYADEYTSLTTELEQLATDTAATITQAQMDSFAEANAMYADHLETEKEMQDELAAYDADVEKQKTQILAEAEQERSDLETEYYAGLGEMTKEYGQDVRKLTQDRVDAEAEAAEKRAAAEDDWIKNSLKRNESYQDKLIDLQHSYDEKLEDIEYDQLDKEEEFAERQAEINADWGEKDLAAQEKRSAAEIVAENRKASMLAYIEQNKVGKTTAQVASERAYVNQQYLDDMLAAEQVYTEAMLEPNKSKTEKLADLENARADYVRDTDRKISEANDDLAWNRAQAEADLVSDLADLEEKKNETITDTNERLGKTLEVLAAARNKLDKDLKNEQHQRWFDWRNEVNNLEIEKQKKIEELEEKQKEHHGDITSELAKLDEEYAKKESAAFAESQAAIAAIEAEAAAQTAELEAQQAEALDEYNENLKKLKLTAVLTSLELSGQLETLTHGVASTASDAATLIEAGLLSVSGNLKKAMEATYASVASLQGDAADTAEANAEKLQSMFGIYTGEGTAVAGVAAQHGANFIVPPGYSDDSFPIFASTGEHVQVTPAGHSSTTTLQINVAGNMTREAADKVIRYAKIMSLLGQ